MDEVSAVRKRTLMGLSKAIWGIIQETPGVMALARKIEDDYELLPKSMRVTIAMVVDGFEKAREKVVEEAKNSETVEGEASVTLKNSPSDGVEETAIKAGETKIDVTPKDDKDEEGENKGEDTYL